LRNHIKPEDNRQTLIKAEYFNWENEKLKISPWSLWVCVCVCVCVCARARARAREGGESVVV